MSSGSTLDVAGGGGDTGAPLQSGASSSPSSSAPPGRERSFSKHDITALTPQQKQALSSMRDKIVSTPLGRSDTASDYTHLRFLRARKFDVEAAVEMYLKCLRWRQDCNIDSVLSNPPTDLRRILAAIVPEAFHKFDRLGLPAYYMKAGKVNPELLLKYVTVDDMVQTHLWGQEFSFKRAEEKSRELGRNIDQFVNVVDLAGLTMSHRACVKYLRTIAALDQQYYPEALGKTYVINAPWIFPALWKPIKGFLDPVTTDKIHVLGGNYRDVLRERFEPADLPAEYGGSCRCAGGCIPEYTEQQAMHVVEEVEKGWQLDDLTLPAGGQHVLRMETGLWGGTFTFYFKSVKADVGFSAVFTPANSRPRQSSLSSLPAMHHLRRKSSAENKTNTAAASAAAAAGSSAVHDVTNSAAASSGVRECPYGERVWQEHARFVCQQPHKGRFVTDYAGVAVFTFDNRHSWRHALSFRFKVNYAPGADGVKKEGIGLDFTQAAAEDEQDAS